MPLLVSISAVLIGAVLFFSPLVASSRDEPALNSFFIAILALSSALAFLQARKARGDGSASLGLPHAALFCAAALGFLSLLWQWLVTARGTPVYLDTMLQGWSYIAALAGVAWAASVVGANRAARYAILFCLVGAAGVSGAHAVQDWMVHAAAHAADWREFSWTTDPDFFAGFLVLTIPVTFALYLGAPPGTAKQWGIIRFVVGLLIAYALTLPIVYGFVEVLGRNPAIVIGALLIVLVLVAVLLVYVDVAPLLIGLSLIWQLAALAMTGSRFALISLAIGLVVVGLALAVARKAGMPPAPRAKQRIAILIVLALLGSVVVARPILHRLSSGTLKSQAHSGDFRIWTWKGAGQMAIAHPILGTGPGTFVYTYPRYALVGFTQLAHNSYLQIADDIGIPALLLILGCLVGTVVLGFRTEMTPAQGPAEPEQPAAPAAPAAKSKRARQQPAPQPARQSYAEIFLAQAALPDDRLLLAGLLGALVAGLIQNLIDSDIYLLYNGVALFALAGLALVFASSRIPDRPRLPQPAIIAGIAVFIAIFLGMAWSGIANLYALSGDYQTAESMVPWSAEYAAGLGWQTYPEEGNSIGAGTELARAAALEPDVRNLDHLGQYYLQQGMEPKALAAFQEGLRTNPTDPELLLNAAQTAAKLGDQSAALAYFRDMIALQHGPVGLVPAVPEAVQYRYAIADSAVADQEMAERDLAGAARDYGAAQAVLEAYVNGGGSRSPYQEVGNHQQPNPALDQSLEELYAHVTGQLETIDQQTGKAGQATGLRARSQRFQAKFASIIAGK